RWYRVRMALYQLPNLPGPGSVNQSGNSSGFGGIGSARRGKPRTSLSFTVFVGPGGAAKQQQARLAYHFEGTPLQPVPRGPLPRGRPAKPRRNPIALAREWQGLLGGPECASRSDLARMLGVTRARVTQVLALLDLAPEVLDAIVALGDPLPRPIISERMLRPLLNLPAEEQRHAMKDNLDF